MVSWVLSSVMRSRMDSTKASEVRLFASFGQHEKVECIAFLYFHLQCVLIFSIIDIMITVYKYIMNNFLTFIIYSLYVHTISTFLSLTMT